MVIRHGLGQRQLATGLRISSTSSSDIGDGLLLGGSEARSGFFPFGFGLGNRASVAVEQRQNEAQGQRPLERTRIPGVAGAD